MGKIKQQSASFPCVLINWKFLAEKAGNGISNTLNLKLFCEGACPHLSNRPSLVEGGRGRVAISEKKKRKKETLIIRLACPQIPLMVGSRSALQFFSRVRTPSHYALVTYNLTKYLLKSGNLFKELLAFYCYKNPNGTSVLFSSSLS